VRELLFISQKIDAFNAWVGRWLSWLVVVVVLVSSINAVMRKTFDVSSNAYLELQWVLFSVIFLLCSPWTLLNGEQWPAKSLIMIAMAMLLAQGVSELIKRIAMMRGVIPDSNVQALSAHEIIEQDAERMIADLHRQ
jgi:TRAP-type mannitol/chloroaromatic compound transport system permease small subunit